MSENPMSSARTRTMSGRSVLIRGPCEKRSGASILVGCSCAHRLRLRGGGGGLVGPQVAPEGLRQERQRHQRDRGHRHDVRRDRPGGVVDRKSTRLNSSHVEISYAVFCLKKKKNI